MAKQSQNITIEDLIEKAKKFVPEVDEKRIREAYSFAEESHEGQFKYDKFPYILHPLNATYLMLELKPDMDAVLACLVHDTHLHNKDAMDFIKKKFGHDVHTLVSDAKKLTFMNVKTYEHQVETLRRMFLAMASDLRVVFIRLADRLHNMMTLEYMEPQLRIKMAQETHDVYAPIASRLGIYQFKSRLEDLTFKNLHPKEYKVLNKEVQKYGKKQQESVDHAISELSAVLKKEGFESKITGRVKHIYSIYNKLKKKSTNDLSSIYDIYALRVVLPDKEDERGREDFSHLYSILGIVHKNWVPLPKRFKDYLAVPKVNGYRSLHTSVVGLVEDSNNPVEIQIRTKSMHEEAEYGIAAHWWYKESSKKKGGKSQSAAREEFQKTLNQYHVFTKLNRILSGEPEFRYKIEKLIKDWDFLSLAEISDIEKILTERGFDAGDMEVLKRSRSKGVLMMRHKYFQNQLEWLEGLAQLKSQAEKEAVDRNLKLDIFKDRIFVLTPHGDVKDLPAGATPVDFAYSVHTDVGNRCAQAKVDGKIVPLDYELKNGQVVEVLTRNEPKPNRYWLSFVKTTAAANKIKGWFANFDRDQNIKEGRDLLNKYLKRIGKSIGDKDFLDISESVGNGEITVGQAIKRIYPDVERQPVPPTKIGQSEKKDVGKVLVGEHSDLGFVLSSCCKPVNGDSIVGYVGRGKKIRIHKVDCQNLKGLDEERFVDVHWMGEGKKKFYQAEIIIEAVSRRGLISEITAVIAGLGCNIVNMVFDRLEGEIKGKMAIEVTGYDQLEKILDRIEGVPSVNVVRAGEAGAIGHTC
ncbi:MAG: hypothetical protein ACD_65C00216G0008 [uncultured bacterium]|nr:MAG: hypothetical protein ACD_65C00216G0008 [uncultured bacterium]OGJ48576.1 MAG: hypothetical protein A2344_04725 [Candidatus Peregrinibacteria bacterium RIFOXYB12_FULL_41_12]OGJ48667.1 MAG: hypothetical protein A2244_03150 [Candidatus Peregrinibacteria bacterium RIFOXYA2_FULL_41_18]OGJ52457.1 MAG: hypothetical protein A2448_03570 [Candidatus Peregrinibacteria bacterium RIFOXYC2_FULL_41_22]OGJ55296.1 MAG: hypothetical protein A2336_01095 [Candidatus Peregrinibacteria bacterium RIFOXYB2_FULL